MRRQTVGAVLQRRLVQTGQTQAELAAACGVSQSTISRWITGERRPWRQAHRRTLLKWGVDPRHL